MITSRTLSFIPGFGIVASVLVLALLNPVQTVLAAELSVSESFPVVGKEFTVMVKGVDPEKLPDLILEVEYRPNSETCYTEAIEPGAELGTWTFSPGNAGLILLKVRNRPDQSILVSQNLSVRFSEIPLAGMMVMVFAGCVLFGGIIVSLRQALSSGHGGEDRFVYDT